MSKKMTDREKMLAKRAMKREAKKLSAAQSEAAVQSEEAKQQAEGGIRKTGSKAREKKKEVSDAQIESRMRPLAREGAGGSSQKELVHTEESAQLWLEKRGCLYRKVRVRVTKKLVQGPYNYQFSFLSPKGMRFPDAYRPTMGFLSESEPVKFPPEESCPDDFWEVSSFLYEVRSGEVAHMWCYPTCVQDVPDWSDEAFQKVLRHLDLRILKVSDPGDVLDGILMEDSSAAFQEGCRVKPSASFGSIKENAGNSLVAHEELRELLIEEGLCEHEIFYERFYSEDEFYECSWQRCGPDPDDLEEERRLVSENRLVGMPNLAEDDPRRQWLNEKEEFTLEQAENRKRQQKLTLMALRAGEERERFCLSSIQEQEQHKAVMMNKTPQRQKGKARKPFTVFLSEQIERYFDEKEVEPKRAEFLAYLESEFPEGDENAKFVKECREKRNSFREQLKKVKEKRDAM
ncbi:MAG: hypothetical protein ACQKBY_11860 [Verrucomicrobiales bacterium]